MKRVTNLALILLSMAILFACSSGDAGTEKTVTMTKAV